MAPTDMRCRSIPTIRMTIKVARIVKTRPKPTIRPPRHPISKDTTARTMAAAATRLTTKDCTAASTMAGWSLTTPISTPTGRSAASSSNRACTASPMRTMLAPGTGDSPIAMASYPSNRMIRSSGSAKARRTSAISRRRTKRSFSARPTTRLSRSVTALKVPVVSTRKRSGPDWTKPEATISFWVERAASTSSVLRPNVRRRAEETATSTVS